MELDASIGAITVAVVSALRARWPTIDGFWVLLVSAVIGAGVGFLLCGQDPKNGIIRGVASALAASGVLRAGAYVLEKGKSP